MLLLRSAKASSLRDDDASLVDAQGRMQCIVVLLCWVNVVVVSRAVALVGRKMCKAFLFDVLLIVAEKEAS